MHARVDVCSLEARWSLSTGEGVLDSCNSAELDSMLASAPLQPPPAFAYRRGPGARASLSSLSLSATNVHLLRLVTAPPTAARDDRHELGTFHAVSQHARDAATEDGDSSAGSDSTGHCKTFGWEDMGSLRSLSLFQAPVPPSSSDDRTRPIIVISESVHLIITETSRCVRCVCALLLPAPALCGQRLFLPLLRSDADVRPARSSLTAHALQASALLAHRALPRAIWPPSGGAWSSF
jgi:hypothetical protein